MKTQVSSILLCVLLSTTLGHEYLNAKRLAPEAKSRHSLTNYQSRSAQDPQQCEWTCEIGPNNPTGGLSIIANETTGLVGIVNITAQVALILDLNANLVGLFNGSTGAVVIVNIKTGAGVYITAGQCNISWIASKQSFEVYFRTLTSLQVLLDLKVGTTFNVTSCSNVILEVVAELLIKLSARIALDVRQDLKQALIILVKVATSLTGALSGSLKGILKLFGRGLIVLRGDILWLVSVLEGFAYFFSKITGGLEGLIKAGVELDIALLLRLGTGIEVLVNILLAIVARVDLSIASGVLNSIEALLHVIDKLGGEQSTGINGLWRLIGQIVAVLNGNLNIDVLIRVLVEYAIKAQGEIDISESVQALIRVIEIQRSKNSCSSLKAFVQLVEQLEKGQLVVRQINISEIISILVKGVVAGPITLVVTVLLRLSVAIKAAVTIPSLLLHLLGLLNTTSGRETLHEAIPTLKISVSSSTNIFVEIFRNVNIQTITQLILTGFDVNTVLTKIPVYGDIYECVSQAVHDSSRGSISLKAILRSSGAASIVQQIQGWIKASISRSHSNSSSSSVSGGSSGETHHSGSWSWSWGGK